MPYLFPKLYKVELSLRLLSSAFNVSTLSLQEFVEKYETQLLSAKNKYAGLDHRHRTLYASIETSIRYLNDELRSLLSGLWIFHSPFLDEMAVAIFDPEAEETEQTPSSVRKNLHTLWQRGLLTRRTMIVRDGTLQFYYLLPTMRPYVEHQMEQAYERDMLMARFGISYSKIARFLYDELDSKASTILIAQQSREDFEQGIEHVPNLEQGYYLLYWGWILYRQGEPRRGRIFLERALEIAQGQDRSLELYAFNNIAQMYQDLGQPEQALRLYKQVLPIVREVDDSVGEATTLSNMAAVYQETGRPKQALSLYKQALSIYRDVGDRDGEATTLNNIALVYHDTGQPKKALSLYKQALSIHRKVGNRTMEGTTLNNIGLVYRDTRRFQQAHDLFNKALPIHREVGNRTMEAITLNNIGLVYRDTGHLQQALDLFNEVLSIHREVGNRATEATTLNNIGLVYVDMGQSEQALQFFEEALPICREVGDRAIEVTTLSNIAILLYQYLNRPQEAINHMEQAIIVLVESGLSQDGDGQTVDYLQQVLEGMRAEVPFGMQANADSPPYRGRR